MTLEEMLMMVEDQKFVLDTRTDAFVQHASQVKLDDGTFRSVLNMRDFTVAMSYFIEKLVERGILTRKYGQ